MKPVILAVTKIITMTMRCGDIDSRYRESSMYDDIRLRRQIKDESGGKYKNEVKLETETVIDGIPVVIKGRADRIITKTDGAIIIEEMKSTEMSLDTLFSRHEQHLGQARCYAYMYLKSAENPPENITVRLTHYQSDTGEVRRYQWHYGQAELCEFFADLMKKYARWFHFERDWKALRVESAAAVPFPFETYRKGQRELAVAAYRAIDAGKKLYVSAPTGIGKTLSTLFPAVKIMGQDKSEKIFYLTAKTVTRAVAEDAIRLMSEKGLRIKSITLRAKDKICVNDERSCNPDYCRHAKGHFDRVNDAIYDMLTSRDLITPKDVEEFAKKHRVCPHEFALDAALWCDIVIGDYNHVFDPNSSLGRFFGVSGIEEKNYIFLIDEAHNLADRVRDMYSATIRKSTCAGIRRHLKDKDSHSREVRKTLKQIIAYLNDAKKENETTFHSEPEQDIVFKALVSMSAVAAGEWLEAKKHENHDLYDEVLNFFFETQNFLMISEMYDEHFTTITEIRGSDAAITLFCLDPSKIIAKGLALAGASVLFSATLTPLEYFRDILGGSAEDVVLSLQSPFDPANLQTVVHAGISTKYADREASYTPIAQAISTVTGKKGNYLVFFPSYDYMRRVHEAFSQNHPTVNTLVQESRMTEDERAEFLKKFDADNEETLIGFTVLGGIFSEGIDLRGDRLIGSIIISVGIPKITPFHDEIRNYFEAKNGRGYDYAYVFPGMNKVLQAAGRVIRTETDTGIVLLIDSRFATEKYRELLPRHWNNIKTVRSNSDLEALIFPVIR